MVSTSADDRGIADELVLERDYDLTVARILAPRLYAGESADRVGGLLLERARKGQFRELLIDFSRVDVVSSTFLGTLTVLHQALRKQGGALRIFGLHESLERVFEVAHLRDLFGIDSDEETARFVIQRSN